MAQLAAAGQDSLVSVSQGGGSYRVCYSTHSSMAELEMFVRHFSPLQITPCAIPPCSTKEEVRNILASFLQPSQPLTDAAYSLPLPHTSMSPHKPRPPAVHTDNARYDPDVWISLSPPEISKRKLEDREDEGHEIRSKVSRVEKEDSFNKISFNDSLDLEANVILEEALSSDEDLEELFPDTKAHYDPTVKNAANESFSLILDPSDDEDIFGSAPGNDNSVEILEASPLEGNSVNDVTENDTPEIEELLAEAEENGLPDYVIKIMKEHKKRQDEVVVID